MLQKWQKVNNEKKISTISYGEEWLMKVFCFELINDEFCYLSAFCAYEFIGNNMIKD